jgi:hypothetical protein
VGKKIRDLVVDAYAAHNVKKITFQSSSALLQLHDMYIVALDDLKKRLASGCCHEFET